MNDHDEDSDLGARLHRRLADLAALAPRCTPQDIRRRLLRRRWRRLLASGMGLVCAGIAVVLMYRQLASAVQLPKISLGSLVTPSPLSLSTHAHALVPWNPCDDRQDRTLALDALLGAGAADVSGSITKDGTGVEVVLVSAHGVQLPSDLPQTLTTLLACYRSAVLMVAKGKLLGAFYLPASLSGCPEGPAATVARPATSVLSAMGLLRSS